MGTEPLGSWLAIATSKTVISKCPELETRLKSPVIQELRRRKGKLSFERPTENPLPTLIL